MPFAMFAAGAAIVRQAAQFHATHDVSLAMTLAVSVVRNGTFDFHERDPVKAFAPIIDYLPVTTLANATGQPAIFVAARLRAKRNADRASLRRSCRPSRRSSTPLTWAAASVWPSCSSAN